MIQTILNYYMLFKAFQTPYPYYAILALLLLIFVFCGVFLRVKNGWLGVFLLVLTLAGIGFGFFLIDPPSVTRPGLDEDTNQVRVVFVNRKGIHLSTGDTIFPAGVAFVERPFRHYRSMVRAINDIVDNSPVTIEWSEEMNGYTITTASGVDVGRYLVSNGLAKTSSLASDELRVAERLAKYKRDGVWQLEVKARPSAWWYIFPFFDGLMSMLLGLLVSFTIGYGSIFILLVLLGRVNYDE